jgi:hypothetical protein
LLSRLQRSYIFTGSTFEIHSEPKDWKFPGMRSRSSAAALLLLRVTDASVNAATGVRSRSLPRLGYGRYGKEQSTTLVLACIETGKQSSQSPAAPQEVSPEDRACITVAAAKLPNVAALQVERSRALPQRSEQGRDPNLSNVKVLDLKLAASRQVVHPCSATTSVSSSLVGAILSLPGGNDRAALSACYLVAMSACHAIPTIYAWREFCVAGDLIGYGPSLATGYHQGGLYVGKVLSGTKPSELPVIQPTKFELVINLKSAWLLGSVSFS